MTDERHTSFLIDHIDPLGQGVYKRGDQIYFIPKTLPGEEGVALVLKTKKNLNFCQLLSVNKESQIREKSPCPHFESCPGCDFLHTDYSNEVLFKTESFKRMASSIDVEEFAVIKADNRLYYRNRIQLHYAKKQMRLGFIQGKQNKILEVPECKIFRPEIEDSFKNAYESKESLLKKQKRPKGHVEFYLQDSKNVKVSWNKRYAQGGFSQVNSEMNDKLLDHLREQLGPLSFSSVLDLFGGNGNLTKWMAPNIEKRHIDLYPEGDHKSFHNHDLFEADSLEDFYKNSPQKNFDLFMVDPPRAGFKSLAAWAERFRPRYIAYVSCHPATMFRDIKALQNPRIESLAMLDLFPSTRHFESFCLIKLG